MIIYITLAIRGFRNNNNNDNNANNNDFEEGDALKKVLSNAARFNSKLEIKELQQNISKPIIVIIKGKDKDKDKVKIKEKTRKPRDTKFEKFFKLFNIYAGFYLANNIKKYITIINLNILIKELKYKLFTLFSLILQILIILLRYLKA